MKGLKEKILAIFVWLVIIVGIFTVGYIALEIIKEGFDVLENIFY